jgi:hypothetical protein
MAKEKEVWLPNPSEIQILESANARNIAKKLQAGGTLSIAEQKVLAQLSGKQNAEGVTITGLFCKTGVERLTIIKRFQTEGLNPIRKRGRRAYYDESEAMKVLAPQIAKRANAAHSEPNIDPETGLTYHQKLEKEKSIEIALRNRDTERAQSNKWLTAEEVDEMLSLLISRIEQLPEKWKSQLGLTDAQVIAIRRGLDEIRTEAAEEMHK